MLSLDSYDYITVGFDVLQECNKCKIIKLEKIISDMTNQKMRFKILDNLRNVAEVI